MAREIKMLSVLIPLLLLPVIHGDMNDADQHDSSSDTSSTSEMDMDLDMHDPNLHNPQPRHGYGIRGNNPQFGTAKTTPTSQPNPNRPNQAAPQTTLPPTHGQQSVLAVIQFGIIVSIAQLL